MRMTANSSLVTLEIPHALRMAFAFIPGQHVAIRFKLDAASSICLVRAAPVNERENLSEAKQHEQAEPTRKSVVRNYSICSSVFDEGIQIAVKKVEGGLVSAFIHASLQGGDYLEVMPPGGLFVSSLFSKKMPLNSGVNNERINSERINSEGINNQLLRQPLHLAAFCAGSGITPVLSILKTFLQLAEQAARAWRFSLFYGNRSLDECMFKEQLYDLKNKYVSTFRFLLFFSSGQSKEGISSGRIEAAKLKELKQAGLLSIHTIDEFFLCGPGDMAMSLASALTKMGATAKQIKTEHFKLPSSSARKREFSKKLGNEKTRYNPAKNTEGLATKSLVKSLALPLTLKKGEHEKRLKETEVFREGQLVVSYEGRIVTLPFEFSKEHIFKLEPKKASGLRKTSLLKGSLLELALTKIDLPHACKGGICGTCRAKLVRGKVHQKLNYALSDEELGAGQILSCQSHPLSSLVELDYDIV